MDSRLLLGVLLAGACNARLAGDPGEMTLPDSNTMQGADAAVDGPQTLGPWGTPQRVPGADSTRGEDDATMSSSRLELYFKRNDTDGSNLYVMTRASTTSAWSAPIALTVLNSTVDEESPRLSQDDLTMYFGRNGDVYMTTRTAIGSQQWTAPVAVTTLNTMAYEKWAAVCDSGYVIMSRSVTGEGQNLFEGDISTGATTAIPQLNSTGNEQGTFLTGDCLRVYFQSNRDGQFNIYTATRPTMTSAWSNATAIPDFNTATFSEEDPWISPDQRTFVFADNSSGNKDVYIATR